MLKDGIFLRLGFAAFAGLIVFGMAKPTLACTCGWVASWGSYARETEFIFIGKALSRTDTDPVMDTLGGFPYLRADPTYFEFEVVDAIKGVQNQTLQIWTPSNSAACGANFELDFSYLVFAYKGLKDSLLHTSLCSHNLKLDSQANDSVLNEVKAAVATSSLRQTREVRSNGTGASMRLRQNGAWQSLESKDRRLDGRRSQP